MFRAQDDSKQKQAVDSRIDSGYGDSGFLSSSNVTSSNVTSGNVTSGNITSGNVLSSDDMKTCAKVEETVTDSGLDIAEDFSRIDLAANAEDARGGEVARPLDEENAYDFSLLRQVIGERGECADTSCVNIREYLIKDEDGDTLLHNAIIHSYYSQMLRLIINAPDPTLISGVNKDGHSPLHLAVLSQESGIVRLLVLSGAKLTSRSNDGNTPLHLACQLGDFDCAKALVDPISLVEHAYRIRINSRIATVPQDLEIKNYVGQACVHIATQKGSVAILRYLLRMGADLESREGLSGKTALMIAITEHNQEIIEFLLNECRPNFETENYAGLTAYQVALSVGEYQLAERMNALGAIPEPLPEPDYSDEDMDEDDDDHPVFLNNSLESDS